jgi:hypothetical protein
MQMFHQTRTLFGVNMLTKTRVIVVTPFLLAHHGSVAPLRETERDLNTHMSQASLEEKKVGAHAHTW